MAHDPGVGSLIVARYHQYLYLDKLSPTPFFGFLVLYNFFLAFVSFILSGHRPTIWVMGNIWQFFSVGFTPCFCSIFGACHSVFDILFTKKPKNPV